MFTASSATLEDIMSANHLHIHVCQDTLGHRRVYQKACKTAERPAGKILQAQSISVFYLSYHVCLTVQASNLQLFNTKQCLLMQVVPLTSNKANSTDYVPMQKLQTQLLMRVIATTAL